MQFLTLYVYAGNWCYEGGIYMKRLVLAASVFALLLAAPMVMAADNPMEMKTTQSDDVEAEDVEKTSTQDDEGKNAEMREVCEVTGTVAKMELVQRSPWTDSAPTTVTTQELLIWVLVEGRNPRNPVAPKTSPCYQAGKNEVRTYKVCAPTQVRPGMKIHGTEGTETGSNLAVGCLFDIAILPKN